MVLIIQVPLKQKYPMEGEMMAVLSQHLEQVPAPVHQQPDSPEMPDALGELVMRMIAKDPSERPMDMNAVRGVLAEVRAGSTVRSS